MEYFDYIISVRKSEKEDWDPVDSAESKEEAIEAAQTYLKQYKFVEVVYMPVDDEDTNDIVWKSTNNKNESLVMNEDENEEEEKPLRKYVSEFSEEEIKEFIEKITWDKLNAHVSKLIGIEVNMVPGELRKGQYITIEDKTNYADKCGIMAGVYETVNVDCFNSALAVDRNTGKLFYWCTPHFSFEYKTYGSNGTEICRANFLDETNSWVFDDSAVGGDRQVKEALTEATEEESEVTDIVLVVYEDGETEPYEYTDYYQADAHHNELYEKSPVELKDMGISGFAHLMKDDDNQFVLEESAYRGDKEEQVDEAIDEFLNNINSINESKEEEDEMSKLADQNNLSVKSKNKKAENPGDIEVCGKVKDLDRFYKDAKEQDLI